MRPRRRKRQESNTDSWSHIKRPQDPLLSGKATGHAELASDYS
jgi:hypothetical protein